MGGRTMPTECDHAIALHKWCQQCNNESAESDNQETTRWYTKRYPAEAVAQLVADGVLVEQKCEGCNGDGRARAWRPGVPCGRCKGSGLDGTYRLVLPEEGE